LHGQTYLNRAMKWAAEEGLENDVVWLDFVAYQDVPELISALDVGTIPFDVTNPTAYYSAPNKIWEYSSQMKPVVSTPIPEALDNRDCVLIASKADDYLHHFLAISSPDEEIPRRLKVGYERACQHTWENAAKMFASACMRVLNEKG